MKYLLLLSVLLVGCGGNSNESELESESDHKLSQSWRSECLNLTNSGSILGVITEYQFSNDSLLQINTYYADTECNTLSQNIENPIISSGEYFHFDKVATTSGVDVDVYEFTLSPPSEGSGKNVSINGVHIDNDIFYWAYKNTDGDYVIFFEQPFHLVKI